MIRSGHVEPSAQELDALAWEFLGSEFTTQIHVDWPIDRCLDAYLKKHGLIDVINDGATYNDLLDRVMANIAPAIRMGLLKLPHLRRQPL